VYQDGPVDLVDHIRGEIEQVKWEKLTKVVEYVHQSGRRDAAFLGVTSEGRYYFDIRDDELDGVPESFKQTVEDLQSFNPETMYFHINQSGVYHVPTKREYDG